MLKAGWKKKALAEFITTSPEETQTVGTQISRFLAPGSILALHGDLGSGKTTLMKGLTSLYSSNLVQSPTFGYLHIYEGPTPLYHFDLYRIQSPEQFVRLGFIDYFSEEGICCIEWAERIEELLPPHTLHLHLMQLTSSRRKLTLYEGI